MNVVGYDCDGKELRPGDKVILLFASNIEWEPYIRSILTVKGRGVISSSGKSTVSIVESIAGYKECYVTCRSIRKIDNYECSNYSFDELVKSIKTTDSKTPQEA